MPIQQPTFIPTLNVDIENASNVKITHLSVVLADTEYSLVLTDGLKELRIRCEEYAELQYAFNAGESSTLYWSIFRGTCDNISDIDFTGKTLYIQCNKPSVTVQVMELF